MSVEDAYLTAYTTPVESWERGAAARFIRITEKWGLKFYQNEAIRNKTYDFQSRCAEDGLAPRVGDLFEFSLPFNENETPISVFGYLTECIEETYGDRYAYKMFGDSYENCSKNQQIEVDDMMFGDRKYNDLITGIYWTGISTKDIHALNIGFIGNRLICIDFSDEDEL